MLDFIGNLIASFWDKLADLFIDFVVFLWGILITLVEWFLAGVWFIYDFLWNKLVGPLILDRLADKDSPFGQLWDQSGIDGLLAQGGFIGSLIDFAIIGPALAACALWIFQVSVWKLVTKLVPFIG